MNVILILAGVLSLALGLIHSILGERMIFQSLRRTQEHSTFYRYRGILWATWHLVTLFGMCLGVYLLELGGVNVPGDLAIYVAWTMFVGAVMVILGTRGKHVGWVVLLLIAILIWIAA